MVSEIHLTDGIDLRGELQELPFQHTDHGQLTKEGKEKRKHWTVTRVVKNNH